MSNQAFSQAADLMVGAGEFYFQRDDDVNGFHHLGNVDEFNITNDVTTVEKNSSMNRKRELMASVTTAVAASASLTLTEYSPYNLALGLYGTEGIHKQAATTIVNESYKVPSAPGIIRLVDADGNPYYNVKNIVVKPATATPSSFTFGTMTGTGDNVQGEVTDASGLKIRVTGSYTGSEDKTYYVRVKTASTASNDTVGIELEVDTLPTFTSPALQTLGPAVGGASTETFSTHIDGLSFALDATNGGGTVPGLMNQLVCVASTQSLKAGVDYVVEEQSSRAGLIKIKNSGAVVAGDTVLVSADVPEGDFVTVSGANAGEISGKLLFVGDPNNGDQYIIEGHKVKIKPDGDMTGLIGTDFGSFNLTVNFLSDYENHPESPFYTATKVGSASGTEVKNGVYDPEE